MLPSLSLLLREEARARSRARLVHEGRNVEVTPRPTPTNLTIITNIHIIKCRNTSISKS